MKKTIQLLSIIASLVLSLSFIEKPSPEYLGTYGVCASDPSQIKLILHSDQRFYYQDFSSSSNKLVVTGKWTQVGKKVRLEAYGSAKKFHKTWTFEENGKVAKSRMGLSFYRLSKLSDQN